MWLSKISITFKPHNGDVFESCKVEILNQKEVAFDLYRSYK